MSKRKLVAIGIVLLVCLVAPPLFAAAAQEEGVAQEVEDIEFLAWWAKKFHPDDANIKYLGEMFNANFSITTIPHNVYFDQLNTKIAADDLPVMYKYQMPNGYAFRLYNEMVEAGRLEDLNPLIDKYNLDSLKSYLAKPVFDHLVAQDGAKYSIPIYIAAETGMLYVRQDWVEQLGLTIPKTWDELKDFARAIKNANPSGKVTAGVGGFITGLIYNSFVEAAGDFTMYNGQWIHRAFHPEYKEAVRYITELYQEGLLHPTSLDPTHGPNERMKLFIDENEGVMMHNGLSSHYANVVGSLTQVNPQAKVDYIPFPANRSGTIVAGRNTPYYGVDTINSSYSESEKVKALQILNYLHSDAGKDLMFDGVEGVHYKVEGGKKVHDPELRKRDFIGAVSPLIEISEITFPFDREVPQLKNNFYGNAEHAYFDEVIGLITEPYLDAVVKINEVVTIYLPKFYSGELDVDKDWDQFLNEIKKNDYDIAIAEIKKFMDR